MSNYKSIIDSGRITLSPFTLLIGNNGSGKSSLIEAIELIRSLSTDPIEDIFLGPKSMEHILHKGKKHGRISKDVGLNKIAERLRISADGRVYGSTTDTVKSGSSYNVRIELAKLDGSEEVRITDELVSIRGSWTKYRQLDGLVRHNNYSQSGVTSSNRLPTNRTLLEQEIGRFVSNWQILGLVPEMMGTPVVRRIETQSRTMHRYGSDVAQALHRLANGNTADKSAYDSIVETMREILGYGSRIDSRRDLGAIPTQYIEFDEDEYTVPGWMLSTGTLRIVALLLALRRPQPTSLICIEELENGLDPRTLELLMNEIKFLTSTKTMQVIATTHSPHLLDQVDLDQVILVQRREGVPHFLKPSESEHVEGFRDHFSPGRLYTMGVLSEAARKLP